jgi:hypothetical protein
MHKKVCRKCVGGDCADGAKPVADQASGFANQQDNHITRLQTGFQPDLYAGIFSDTP